MNFIANIVKHRDLFLNLVKRELKARYRDTGLGFLWSILNPLFMAIIYMIFLRLLVGRGVATEDVIIGVFAWQFTAQSISGGMSSITGNATLIKKIYFPRVILPLSVIAGNLINYVLTIFVQLFLLFFILFWKGSMIGVGLFAMPIVILYQTLFILGMVLVVSSANVYFRDIQHIVNLLLTAWFFMTPAIYNLTFIQPLLERFPLFGNLYFLNPMASIITMYRALLLPESVHFWSWGVVLGLVWPVFFLYFAYRIFQSAQRNFADYV